VAVGMERLLLGQDEGVVRAEQRLLPVGAGDPSLRSG
jgi:hypothetical protein